MKKDLEGRDTKNENSKYTPSKIKLAVARPYGNLRSTLLVIRQMIAIYQLE